MSTAQILNELPRLSHADRREIVRRLIELEEEAHTLADADARADANFQVLDALEAQDKAHYSVCHLRAKGSHQNLLSS